MQVSKSGKSLADWFLSIIVKVLGLKEGGQTEIRAADDRTLETGRDQSRQRALASLRKLRRPVPAGFVFDRNDANTR